MPLSAAAAQHSLFHFICQAGLPGVFHDNAPGTKVAQKGGQAFGTSRPASSSTQRPSRHLGRDVVESVAKAEARSLQAQRQEIKATDTRRLETLLRLQDDRVHHPLRERKGLKDICKWLPIPHSCPSAFARLEAWTFSSAATVVGQKAGLARAWRRRHVGLPKRSLKYKSRPDHRCWQQGFCHCSGRGRATSRCWNSARQSLQQTMSRNSFLKEKFATGEICVRWRSESIELHEVGGGEVGTSEVGWTYVALHSQRPWSPLFMMMEEVVSGQEREAGVVLRVQKDAEHCPRFKAPLDLVSTFDLQKRMHLQVYYLSTSRKAFPHSAGCVVVYPGDDNSDPERCFWAGLQPQQQPQQNPGASQWLDVDLSDGIGERPGGAEHDGEVLAADNDDVDSDNESVVPEEVAEKVVVGEVEGEHANENEDEIADDDDDLFPRSLLDLWAGSWDRDADSSSKGASSSSSSSDETSSSSSSSSSDSGSSSSSSDEGDSNQSPAAPPSPNQGLDNVADDANVPEDNDTQRNAARVRRPESFELGAFLFTFKPPRSYQCTCKWHLGKPTCTKSCTYDGSEAGMEDTLKRLKCWALTAPEHDDKVGHAGGMRGVPLLGGADAFRSMAELDQAIVDMGFPPA